MQAQITAGRGFGRGRSDALRRTVVAVQDEAERVACRIDVRARHLDRVAHQCALDLFRPVVFVRTEIERHHPVALGNRAHARGRVVAVAAPGNLVHAAHPLAQFAGAAAVVVVGLQEGAAGRREVRRERMQVRA